MSASPARRVFFLTGIRSEYDILAPVIAAVDNTPGMAASVVVTGAHLSPAHGLSVRQIDADGFRVIARIPSLSPRDTLAGRVSGMATQLEGLAATLERERPELFVVMGDREESMTGALAAVYLRVPVVHLGGGDHADDGNVDNVIRHAVTKLSSLHMVTTERSAQRVLALGEEAWRVHIVGSAGLDRLAQTPSMTRAEVFAELGVDWSDEYLVVLFHPTIRDYADARANMDLVLRAIEPLDMPIVIIHPNSDPGSRDVVAAIDAFVGRRGRAKAFTYLPRTTFVNLLRGARVLVGNSSAGILEAPFLGLPAVNIALRQRGREHAGNVIFVDYAAPEIAAAVERAATDIPFRAAALADRDLYGDGRTAERIASILSEVELGETLLAKAFLERTGAGR